MPDLQENKNITETLYEHNLELAIVNKTLSLLRKLYQISLLSLDPYTLSKQISDAIRLDLKLEIVGIFSFSEKDNSFLPFDFSKSDRAHKVTSDLNFLFKDFVINEVSHKKLLEQVVNQKISVVTNNLEDVWGGIIKNDNLKKVTQESNIKEAVIYPLLIQNKVIGALFIAINREYSTLNEHEKDSIKSCLDVISVALDKAYLYKELQDANENLRNLIKQRESLVHLITHKVKGSFTRSKFLFAEMLDGTFGELSPMLSKMVKRGFDSDVEGINTVDLVLNSANLQNGTVKYDLKPTDFKDLTTKVFEEKKAAAEAKNLKMDLEVGEGAYTTLGDAFWLKEVLVNLYENAIRYTREGSIKVVLKNTEAGKILLSVSDTGVGITEEDKKNLFKEGGRGKESVKINVDSTGYGLFSVKLIVDAHKGRIWADSEGADKGTTFYLELDRVV